MIPPRGYSYLDRQNSPYNNVTLEDMYRVSGLTPAPIANISAIDFNTILEQRNQERIQIYDIGGKAGYNRETQQWENPFRLETGYKRDDAQNLYESVTNKEVWRNNLTDTRTHWRAGMYGANPFSVSYDRQLLNMPDIGPAPEQHVNPIARAADHIYSFFYENWDFDEVKEILNKQDSNFNFQENGWNEINTEFGPEQGELVKKALIQNGWNPEQDGQGAGNRDAYMYAVKRKLRETAYVQWAENFMAKKFNQSGILDDPRAGRARIFQDIITDYEIVADVGLMYAFGKGAENLLARAARVIQQSQRLSKVQNAIKAGRAGFVRNAQGSLVAKGQGLGKGIVLSSADEVALRQAGALTDIAVQPTLVGGRLANPATRLGTTTRVGRNTPGVSPSKGFGRRNARRSNWNTQTTRGQSQARNNTFGSAPRPKPTQTTWGVSNRATIETIGVHSRSLEVQNAMRKALGYSMRATGGVLDFFGFQKAGNKARHAFSRFAHNSLAAGSWGAITGFNYDLAKQQDDILMADIISGSENHNMSLNLGQLAKTSLLFGGIGVALGGVLGGFMGGYFKNWFGKESEFIGFRPKDWKFKNALGFNEEKAIPENLGELVHGLGEDQAINFLARMIDELAREPGRGASLLSSKLVKTHSTDLVEVMEFVHHLQSKVGGGNYLPIEVVEELVGDFLQRNLKDRAGGRALNQAERIARNKESAIRAGARARREAAANGADYEPWTIDPRRYDNQRATLDQQKKEAALRNELEERAKELNKMSREDPRFEKLAQEYEVKLKEHDDLIDTLPALPEDLIPEIRFKDYDYAIAGEDGALVANIIRRREELDQAINSGLPEAEIKLREKAYREALDVVDKKYPRVRDGNVVTRNEVLQQDLSILFSKLRNAEAGTDDAVIREQLVSKLMDAMGGSLPAGDKAASLNWFDSLFNGTSMGGKFLNGVATLGTAQKNLLMSDLAIVRQLAEMIDNSQEALISDIANFGKMNSVWSAQRKAYRDAAEVMQIFNQIESAFGSYYRVIDNAIKDSYGEGGKLLTKKEFIDKVELRGDVPVDEKTMERMYEMYKKGTQAVKDYFSSYAKLGEDTQILRRMSQDENYLPLMFADTMPIEHIEKVANAAFDKKAATYLDNEIIPTIELARVWDFELEVIDGRLSGRISKIHETSPLYIQGMTQKEMIDIWSPELTNPTVGKVNAIEKWIQDKRVSQGLEPFAKLDLNVDRSKTVTLGKINPKQVELNLNKTKNYIGTRLDEGDLNGAAVGIFTLERQARDFAASNPTASREALAEALRLKDNLKKRGIEIENPLAREYTGKEEWVVIRTNEVKAEVANRPSRPVVIHVDRPQVSLNGKVVVPAKVVLDPNIQAKDVKFYRQVEEAEVILSPGETVKRVSDVDEEPTPLVVERVFEEDGEQLVKVRSEKNPIPAKELETLYRKDPLSSSDNIINGVRFNRDNPLAGTVQGEDWFVTGMRGLQDYVETITGERIDIAKLGFGHHLSKEAQESFTAGGVLPYELLDLLNQYAVQQRLYLLAKYDINLPSGLLIKEARGILDVAQQKLRKQAEQYLESLRPVRTTEQEISVVNWKDDFGLDISDTEEAFLAATERAIKRGDVTDEATVKKLAAARKLEEEYLARLDAWRSRSVDDVIEEVSNIKIEMVTENVNLIKEGNVPKYTRDDINKVIKDKYGIEPYTTKPPSVQRKPDVSSPQSTSRAVDDVVETPPALREEGDLDIDGVPSNGELTRNQNNINGREISTYDTKVMSKLNLTEEQYFEKGMKSKYQKQYAAIMRKEKFDTSVSEKLSAIDDLIQRAEDQLNTAILKNVENNERAFFNSPAWKQTVDDEFTIRSKIAELEEQLYVPRNQSRVDSIKRSLARMYESLEEMKTIKINPDTVIDDALLARAMSGETSVRWDGRYQTGMLMGKTAGEFKNAVRAYKGYRTRVVKARDDAQVVRDGFKHKSKKWNDAHKEYMSLSMKAGSYNKNVEYAEEVLKFIENPQVSRASEIEGKERAIANTEARLRKELDDVIEDNNTREAIKRETRNLNNTLRKRKSLADESPNDLQGEIIRLKAERKMIEYIKQLAEFAEDTGQPIVLPKSGGLSPIPGRELGPDEFGPAFPTRIVTAQQMLDTPIELLNNGIVRYTAAESRELTKAIADINQKLVDEIKKKPSLTIGDLLSLPDSEFRNQFNKMAAIVRYRANNRLPVGAREISIQEAEDALQDALLFASKPDRQIITNLLEWDLMSIPKTLQKQWRENPNEVSAKISKYLDLEEQGIKRDPETGEVVTDFIDSVFENSEAGNFMLRFADKEKNIFHWVFKQNESGEWVKTRRRTQPKKKGKKGRIVTTGEKGTLNMGVVIRKAAELLRTNARKRVLKQPTTQLIDGKEVDTRVVKLFSTNSEDFVDESVVGMGSGLHMQGTWGRPLAELMAGETRTSIDKVRKSLFRRIPDTDTYTNEAARTEAQRWNHDIARREALFEFLADQQPATSRFYKGSTVRDKKTKRFAAPTLNKSLIAEEFTRRGFRTFDTGASISDRTIANDLLELSRELRMALRSTKGIDYRTRTEVNKMLRDLLKNDPDFFFTSKLTADDIYNSDLLYRFNIERITGEEGVPLPQLVKASPAQRSKAIKDSFEELYALMNRGTEAENALYRKQIGEITKVYQREYSEDVANILMFGVDADKWITRELQEVEDLIAKTETKVRADNERYIKTGKVQKNVRYLSGTVYFTDKTLGEYVTAKIKKVVLLDALSAIKKDATVLMNVAPEKLSKTMLGIDQKIGKAKQRPFLKVVPTDNQLQIMAILKEFEGTQQTNKAFFDPTQNPRPDDLSLGEGWKTTWDKDMNTLKEENAIVYNNKTKSWELTREGRIYLDHSEQAVIKHDSPWGPEWNSVKNTQTGPNGLTPMQMHALDVLKRREQQLVSKTGPLTAAEAEQLANTRSRIYNLEFSTLSHKESRALADLHLLHQNVTQLQALKRGDLSLFDSNQAKEIKTTLENLTPEQRASGEFTLPESSPHNLDMVKAYDRAIKKERELTLAINSLVKDLRKSLGLYKGTKDRLALLQQADNPNAALFNKQTGGEKVIEPWTPSKALSELDSDRFNLTYRGHNDNLSSSEKVQAALKGSKRYYSAEGLSKFGDDINDGETALRDAMRQWAHRLNGANTSRRGSLDQAYRNVDGEMFDGGETQRVFSTEEVMSDPAFRDLFEGDIRKLVANYARTMGTKIQSQKVLNEWLQKFGIVDPKFSGQLKNLRWEDLFEHVRTRIRNMNQYASEGGQRILEQNEINSLVKAVDLAEDVYHDLIGRPRYDADPTGTLDKLASTSNHLAQAMFGPGISTSVALVEIPMAILARSGDFSAIGKGLSILKRDLGNMDRLDLTDLEGTAFVLDNYLYSGLHRYDHLHKIDMEYKAINRVKKAYREMFEGDNTMDRIDNFLAGLAKMGGEATGLRQVILMGKNIAIGKGKYNLMSKLDKLYAFSSNLDIKVLNELGGNMNNPSLYKSKLADAQQRYIKRVAREVGLDEATAIRWYRAGLAGTNDGSNLNSVIDTLLQMGNASRERGFSLTDIHSGIRKMQRESTMPYGKLGSELYEDTADRLALFLEMHAHDLSPELRGVSQFHAAKNPLGRLFTFYISYPVAFFTNYMKKNPSEVGTLGALAALSGIVGLETFHQQVKAIARGEDVEELAEKWKEHPWAMLTRESSHTPFLGLANSAFRNMGPVPLANSFIGDQTFQPELLSSVGLGALERNMKGVQGIFEGDILTRGRNNASKDPRLIDRLARGFSGATGLSDEDADKLQASYFMNNIYDTLLPTRAFYWQMAEHGFQAAFGPTEADTQRNVLGSFAEMIDDMNREDPEGVQEVMKELSELYMSEAQKLSQRMQGVTEEQTRTMLQKPSERFVRPPAKKGRNAAQTRRMFKSRGRSPMNVQQMLDRLTKPKAAPDQLLN